MYAPKVNEAYKLLWGHVRHQFPQWFAENLAP
jgi:hypothetical protein